MSNELQNQLNKVARGASIIFLGLIIGNIIGVINQILLARFMGPDEYGILNLGISVVSIIGTIASFGLVGSLPVCVSQNLSKKRANHVINIILFAFKFILSSSILLGLLIFIFSNFIAISIFREPSLSIVLKLFAIFFPFLVLPNISQSILRAFDGTEYKIYLFDIGMPLFKLLIFIALLMIGDKLLGAVIAYIASLGIVFFISLYIIQTKCVAFLLHEYEKIDIGKKMLMFSFPLALTGATFLLISKTDTVLLGYFSSPEEIGIYSAALNIVSMMTFIGKSFEWVFLPLISKYFASNQLNEVELLFKSSSKWMFIATMPVFILIALFSKEIIYLMFGQEYIKGSSSLIILAFGISMNMVTGLTGSMLVGRKETKLNLIAEIIGGITNILFNVLLIPVYGIVGAAIGTSISYFTRNCASLAFVYRTSHMHPFEINNIKIVLSAIVVTILVHFIKIYLNGFFNSWIGLIFIAIFLSLFYLVLLYKTGCIDYNDKVAIKSILKKNKA